MWRPAVCERRADRTGAPLPVWQGLSQSDDVVAQSQPPVERAAVLFAAVYPLKLPLRLLTPRLLIVKRHGGSVARSP
jgi:hypothetical protein